MARSWDFTGPEKYMQSGLLFAGLWIVGAALARTPTVTSFGLCPLVTAPPTAESGLATSCDAYVNGPSLKQTSLKLRLPSLS
jgi:hypothetical protein